jgi:hypothetical protein
MTAWDWLRVGGILGPIAALLTVGFWLTLRSGVVGLSAGQRLRCQFANVSRATFLVGGSLVALVVVQRIVGFHLALAW